MKGVPLKEYVDKRFEDADKAIQKALESQEKAVNAALASSEKAVDKAEKTAEKWRENANEWREAMNDRESSFARKADGERNAEDIKKLQLSEATLAGKASQNSVIFLAALAIASLIVSLIALFIK